MQYQMIIQGANGKVKSIGLNRSLTFQHHRHTGNHMPYGTHSVTCHPAEVTFPPSP